MKDQGLLWFILVCCLLPRKLPHLHRRLVQSCKCRNHINRKSLQLTVYSRFSRVSFQAISYSVRHKKKEKTNNLIRLLRCTNPPSPTPPPHHHPGSFARSAYFDRGPGVPRPEAAPGAHQLPRSLRPGTQRRDQRMESDMDRRLKHQHGIPKNGLPQVEAWTQNPRLAPPV